MNASAVPASTAGNRTFMLPDLGEGLSEAEVVQWHVAAGDEVRVDQIVVTVETAKATVDLPCPYADLAPTGAGGVISRADVEAAIRVGEAGSDLTIQSTAPGAIRADRTGDIRVPLRGVRRAIAQKVTISRREIPEATTWVDVDATALMTATEEIRTADGAAGIGVLALLARISVVGLRKFPELNARVDVEAREILQIRDINLSFAAQSPRGLVVPVVHGASEMTTTELAAALRELTDLAREGRLDPAQMTGGTFTLNNYGVFGTDGANPIINYPEAAMLGVGRIIDRPWAHEGQLALRKVGQLGRTFDHRVCDGRTAGGFLRFVADCVEKPSLLLALL